MKRDKTFIILGAICILSFFLWSQKGFEGLNEQIKEDIENSLEELKRLEQKVKNSDVEQQEYTLEEKLKLELSIYEQKVFFSFIYSH